MSLKKKIEEAYKEYAKESQRADKYLKLSNYETVALNVKKLNDDLCKFAADFDSYFDNGRAIDTKVLKGEKVDDMYCRIQKEFVERIAKEDNNFVYGDTVSDAKEESIQDVIKKMNSKYSSNIKEFNSRYKNLKSDFKKSKNIIDFMNESSYKFSSLGVKWENDSMSVWVTSVNRCLDKFISEIFEGMYNELNLTAKFLEAKDEDYFYNERGNNIFSRVIRHLFPRLWSLNRTRKKYKKHAVEPVKENTKVFPQGKPTVKEVKQSFIGDCYLLSALISLAKKKPQAIKDCFVQGMDRIEKEDNIAIRFFYRVGLGESQGKSQVKINISKKKVILPRDIKGGALWPKLIEKAYAIYRKEGYEQGINKWTKAGGVLDPKIDTHNQKLDSGNPYCVFFAITGEDSTWEKDDDSALLNRNHIISVIKRKLDKNEVATCSFDKKFRTKDIKCKQRITIYPKHAYAIVGVNEEKKYVRLINPWKRGGRSKKNSPTSKEGGHIAMSYDDFNKHLATVDYTKS